MKKGIWRKIGGVGVIVGFLVLYGCGADETGSQEPVDGIGNADTVDGYHASNIPQPNTLLALNDQGKLPADITGDADTLDGKHATDFALAEHTHDDLYVKKGVGNITAEDIKDGSLTSADIQNGTILFEDIGNNGCALGQVMKFDGSAWACADDVTGGDMFKAVYDTDDDGAVELCESVPWTGISGMPAGFADGIDDDTQYTAGVGLTLTGTEFSVNQSTLDGWYVNEGQPNSITSVMIQNGTILFEDIGNNDCALGQVMKFDGSAWACADDVGGGDMFKAVYDTDDNNVVDDAERLDGRVSSYYLDISPTNQVKEGGLQVGYLDVATAGVTIYSDGITNMIFTDNAGTTSFTLTQLAGWNGFATRIKILPNDFLSTETSDTIGIVPSGAYAFTRIDGTADFVATYNIPNGFRATEVMVYGSEYTGLLKVYECQIDTNTCVGRSSGCNVGTSCDITDVSSTDTNYLSIYVRGDGHAIYGGYISIVRN